MEVSSTISQQQQQKALPEVLDDLPFTIIAPRRGWFQLNLGELWKYRELLFYLTWRDILIRYKQTALGIAWAFLQPLATTIIFAMFLGRAGGIANSIPFYTLYVLAGILPWTFLSNSVQLGGNSLLTNQNLVSKVYFPRLLVPLSCLGGSLFDLMISCLMVPALCLWYGVAPSLLAWIMVPLCLVLLVFLAAGMASLLAALVVVQRDFRYILGFGVQMWMFATPTLYMDGASITGFVSWLLPLNPAYGIIQNLQYALLNRPPELYNLLVSSTITLLLFLLGIIFFSRVERQIADVI
jgi:lipopolysaccharide transport system permease protein